MGGVKVQILIVDDDELIVDLIKQNLILEGYSTLEAYDGVQAIEMTTVHKPDLIILDIMMPKKDGYHVCKELRSSGIPIIMLTAKGDISDKLMGLELGADDYIVKPFDTRELLARVKAIIRRVDNLKDKNTKNLNSLNSSNRDLVIIESSHRVMDGDKEIHLTPTEYDLLLFLYKNPERVFDREQLVDRVWGYDFLGDSRTVDIHIQRLRKKLGAYGKYIQTIYGVGYRYMENKNEA